MNPFFIPFRKLYVENYWSSVSVRLHGGKSSEVNLNYEKYASKLINFIGISRPRRILDVGCGDGTLSFLISKYYTCPVDGIEFSPALAEIYRSKNIGSCYQFKASETWESVSNVYDIVYLHGVIQYLTYSEILRLADNCFSCLASNSHSILIIAGACDKSLATNWYFQRPCKKYRFIIQLVKYFYAMATSRLWSDGSMWHNPLAIRRILLSYFRSVEIVNDPTSYRSNFICRL